MSEADDIIFNEQFLDGTDNEYILKSANMDDILSDLNLSIEDTAITKSIILGLEEEAAKAIKENICVCLPNMGNVQRDAFKDLLRQHNKELQFARKTMSKEDYKEYVKDLRRTLKNQAKEDYNKRKVLERYKRGKAKLFEDMCFKRGKAYANMYVQALLGLKTVEYNQEVQDQYDRINNNDI